MTHCAINIVIPYLIDFFFNSPYSQQKKGGENTIILLFGVSIVAQRKQI